MKLMTRELELKLPGLYSQEEVEDPVAVAKWFCPWNGWTWWATEYRSSERLCFGLVRGFEVELGYFSLDELAEVRGPGGLRIECDLYWKPVSLSVIRANMDRG